MRWIILLQTAIGVTLLAAAASKLIARGSLRPFLDDLGLPPRLGATVSRSVPLLEAGCGILLLAGMRVWSALAATLVSALFTMTLGIAWHSGVSEGCRCFGSLDRGAFSPISLARAAGLAGASAVLVWLHLRGSSGSTRPTAEAGTAVAVGLGVGVAAAYLAAFALVEEVRSFQRMRLAPLVKRFAAAGHTSSVHALRRPTAREEIR